MEVSVTSSLNLPPDSVISIRSGETRRQAPFKLNQVFRFPNGSVAPFKVDVFQPLGHHAVNVNSLHEGDNSLKVCMNQMELDLKIVKDTSGEKPPNEKNDRLNSALQARSYLDDHDLVTTLQEMLQEVIKCKPGDPIDFMIDYMQHRQDESKEKSDQNAALETADFGTIIVATPSTVFGGADQEFEIELEAEVEAEVELEAELEVELEVEARLARGNTVVPVAPPKTTVPKAAPAEAAVAEATPVDTAVPEVALAEAVAAEPMPTEAAPVEVTPAEPTPTEAAPAEATPEATPAEAAPPGAKTDDEVEKELEVELEAELEAELELELEAELETELRVQR
eukprot:GEMP01025354.1.p1 GENE.GEMP01025354.1~~GEMP01025354.1.p1  ORF type:complete len:339 (+),score=71.49 GEMP01025354.1:126-1142(+)